MIQEEKGFTFIESLLVLTVASIVISVTAVSLLPLFHAREADQFVEQLRQDIAFMQQAAISNNSRYSLRLYTASHKYVITKSGETRPALSRSYNPAMEVDLHTMPNPLAYGEDGNINKAGTMYVSYKEKKYSVVFLLGRGRMYYYEV